MGRGEAVRSLRRAEWRDGVATTRYRCHGESIYSKDNVGVRAMHKLNYQIAAWVNAEAEVERGGGGG